MAVQKAELIKVLKQFPLGTETSLIFFSGPSFLCGEDPNVIMDKWTRITIHEFKPKNFVPKAKWIHMNPKVISKLKEQILKTELSKGTDWYWPFKMAANLNPKPDTVFFMTDGDTSKIHRTIQLVRTIKANAGSGFRVNTIGFGLKKGEGYDALKEIAKMTGGSFKPIDKNEIDRMYKALPKHFK